MFVVNMSLVYALLSVLILIFLNLFLGVAIAFKNGEFDLQELPRFLKSEILPYGISLTALIAAAQVDFGHLAGKVETITSDALIVIAWTAIGAYVLKMIQEIGKKILELFGVEPARKYS